MYAHFQKIYLLPKEGISTFKINMGEDEARRRVDELAEWVDRITLVHMVHGQAFNDYFRKKAPDMLGLDVSKWGEAGVPTEEEIEAIFQRDLEDLKDVPINDAPEEGYSLRLVPVSQGAPAGGNAPGDREAGAINPIDKMVMLVKIPAGETATLKFGPEESSYAVTYFETADYEMEMDQQFATPLSSGKVEAQTLEIKAPVSGYYIVRLKGGSLKSVSHPHAVPLETLHYGDGRLYFFVPAGTKEFTFQTHARGAPTVRIIDPQGKVHVSQDGFAVTNHLVSAVKLPREWTVKVPAGTDGAVWSFEGPRNVYHDSTPVLTGVPSYFALSPDLLLTPEDALQGE